MNDRDPDLEEVFGLIVDKQTVEAMLATATDPYYMNYPAIGSIPSHSNDIICGHMPTGEPITLDPFRSFCNIGVFGRTGSSKTSWLSPVLLQFVGKGFLVIVFQQKTEYDDWATAPELVGKVLPLRFEEFKISRLQSPPGVPARSHLHTHFRSSRSLQQDAVRWRASTGRVSCMR
jgi:hypothetical protein